MGLCEIAVRDSGRASLGRILCLVNLLVSVLAEVALIFLLNSTPRWHRDEELYGGRAISSWHRLLLATSLTAGTLHLLGAKLCHDCGYWWSRHRFQSALPHWVLAVLVSAGVSVAAAVVTFTAPARLTAGLQDRLEAAMSGYRDNPQHKAFLDRLQQRGRCCGVWGLEDWMTTSWLRREDVPGRGPSYKMNVAYENMVQEDGSLLVKWAPWSCCDPQNGEVCNSAYEVLPHPASYCDSLRQKSSLLQAELPADERLDQVRPHATAVSPTAAPSIKLPDTITGAAAKKLIVRGKPHLEAETQSTVPTFVRNPAVKQTSKTVISNNKSVPHAKKEGAQKLTNAPVSESKNKPHFKHKTKPFSEPASSKIWINKKGKQSEVQNREKMAQATKFPWVTTRHWRVAPPNHKPQPNFFPPPLNFGPPPTVRMWGSTSAPRTTKRTFYPPLFGFGPPPLRKHKKRTRRELLMRMDTEKTTPSMQGQSGNAGGLKKVTESMESIKSIVRKAGDDTGTSTKRDKVQVLDADKDSTVRTFFDIDMDSRENGAVIMERNYSVDGNKNIKLKLPIATSPGDNSTRQKQNSSEKYEAMFAQGYDNETDFYYKGGNNTIGLQDSPTSSIANNDIAFYHMTRQKDSNNNERDQLMRPEVTNESSHPQADDEWREYLHEYVLSDVTDERNRSHVGEIQAFAEGMIELETGMADNIGEMHTHATQESCDELVRPSSLVNTTNHGKIGSRGAIQVSLNLSPSFSDIVSVAADNVIESSTDLPPSSKLTLRSDAGAMESSKIPLGDVTIRPSSAPHPERQRRRAIWIVDHKPDPRLPLPPDPRYNLPDGPNKDFLFTAIQNFMAEYRNPRHDCDALLESGKNILAKIEAVPGLPEAMRARERDSSNFWTLYYMVNGITTTPDPRPYAKYIMRLIDRWRNQDFVHSSPREVAKRVIRYFKPCLETIRPPLIPSRDCPPPWKHQPNWYLANFDDDEYTTEILRPAYNEMEVFLHMERTGTKDVVFTDFRKQRLKREIDRVDEQLILLQQYNLEDPLEMRYDVLFCRLKQEPSDTFFEMGCLAVARTRTAAVFGLLPYLLATMAVLQLLTAVLARYLQSANESAARHGDLRLTAYGCLLGRATGLPPEATGADSTAIYTDEDELAAEGIKLARPQEITQRSPRSLKRPGQKQRKPKKKKKKRKRKDKKKRRRRNISR